MSEQRPAVVKVLEDGTFVGTVPGCPGVIAFADTREACEAETYSVLAEWDAVRASWERSKAALLARFDEAEGQS